MEKKKQKRMQGARKPRKDEEMTWAPPRNISKWPDWEDARKMEESEWRLEPEGEAEVPEAIIVSDAVECILEDLDDRSPREEQKKKHQREWKRSKRVDRTEMRKEEKRLRCAF